MPHISDRHRLLLNALFVVFLAAPILAQTAQLKYVVDGSAPGARWGAALSSGADLDSDGLTDIVVGTSRGCSFEDYVTAVRGIDGSVLWKRSHLGSNCDHFGTVELIGDLDGDGVSDMVVGAPQANGNRGQAHIISTGSLATLFTINAAATAPDDRFGSGVGRLGDITGDGIPEFTVTASSADPCCGHYVGTVQAFDGATFAPIWQANGSAGQDYAKQKLGKDINGDGVREVTWHSQQDGFSPKGPGYVRLVDGATGAEMWRVDGDNLEDHFGDQWCLLDDIDGDGVYDFALVVPLGDFFGPNLGEVQVRSGADLTIHYRIPLLPNSGGVGVGGESGGSVCELPDLNGDGAPEFAVGQGYARSSAGDAGTETGALVIVSGADGAVLDTLWGENAADGFGLQVRVMQNFTMVGGLSMVVAAPGYANETGRIYVYELGPPDCNANGIPDVDEIAADPSLDCNGNGVPDECDIASDSSLDQDGNGILDECLPPPLASNPVQISVASGGQHDLSLTAPQEYGNSLYFVLGSSSGTVPGWTLDGVLVPLQIFDPYFLYGVSSPNVSPFINTLGSLSATGTASAAIAVPSGLTDLAGVTIHHAYVLFGNSLEVVYASNAAPLELVP